MIDSRTMLVLPRQVDESIIIGEPPTQWIVTVSRINGDRSPIELTVQYPSHETRQVALAHDESVDLGNNVSVTLVGVRMVKARLGISAPKEMCVHRLEVWEAIRGETFPGPGPSSPMQSLPRERESHLDDGPAGILAPKPVDPRLPDLKVRLEEPREPDEPRGPEKKP